MGNYPVVQVRELLSEMVAFEKNHPRIDKDGTENSYPVTEPVDVEAHLEKLSKIDDSSEFWETLSNLYQAFIRLHESCATILELTRRRDITFIDRLYQFAEINNKINNLSYFLPNPYANNLSIVVRDNTRYISAVCPHIMQPDYSVESFHKVAKSCKICDHQIVG